MELRLDWDSSQTHAFKSRGLEKALFKALSKAGGDALRKMRTDGKQRVRGRKRIKAGAVAKSMRLTYPRGSQDIESLVWQMDVSGKPQPVVTYPSRQTAKGVSVVINEGKRVLIKSAFIATMRSGHKGVFVRTGEKVGPRGGKNPIKELFTSRVTDVFHDDGMIPSIFAQANVVFRSSFDRLLPLEVARLS